MNDGAITTSSSAATRSCGAALGPLLEPGDVILLSGDLGAGKTQLTKGIAAGLGVAETVTSPTFNLLLVHEGRLTLNHFDLYRLDHEAQLEDLDYFGTLESEGVSVVEWGDRFPGALPADGLDVVIHTVDDETRVLQLKPLGPRGERLAREWTAACGEIPDVRAGDAAVPGGDR